MAPNRNYRRKQPRLRSANAGLSRLLSHSSTPQDAAVLELFEYEIVDEPMPDQQADRLPETDRVRINEAGILVQDDPQQAIDLCEQLVREFPDIPKLYNYLAAAYEATGRRKDAEKLIEETVRRFPRYLFGLCSLANFRMLLGRVDEVPAILGEKFALHHLYPDRRRFHISEFLAFTSMIGQFFELTGKTEAAKTYYKMLLKIAPEHPATRQLGEVLHPRSALAVVAKAIRRLTATPSRGRRTV